LYDSGKPSDRKLRLFAAACCRLVWPLLADQGSWTAVEVVERYADGQATAKAMAAAAAQAWVEGARTAALPDAWQAVRYTSCSARWLGGEAELANQAGVVRDLFGPWAFRARPVIADDVLAWNDGCIVKLATHLYEQRDFSCQSLGVVADALEEAG